MPRRGEGIYKRKDGRWEARYIHHYEDGKAKYRSAYGASYAEVKAKRSAQAAFAKPIASSVDKEKSTFKEPSEDWLLEISGKVKESTYTRYHRMVHVYLLPNLGRKQLTKHLKGVRKKLLETGGQATSRYLRRQSAIFFAC